MKATEAIKKKNWMRLVTVLQIMSKKKQSE